MNQKTILINLGFLAGGLLIAYALNQHFIGHSTAGMCEVVTENQNNFIAEIILILTFSALFFGLRFLWKNAPVLSISAAIISFVLLAFTQNENEKQKFKFQQAHVQKVWSAK
jgi:hypothetical protein